jgi:hypothetical protein
MTYTSSVISRDEDAFDPSESGRRHECAGSEPDESGDPLLQLVGSVEGRRGDSATVDDVVYPALTGES